MRVVVVLATVVSVAVLALLYFRGEDREERPAPQLQLRGEYEPLGDRRGYGGLPMHIRDPRNGVRFRLIPPGKFLMGSADDLQQSPVRLVRIETPFYLAETVVTAAQWMDFAKSGAHSNRAHGELDLENRMRADHAIVSVSWHDARAYCEHYGYHLPSEAQWEYACRAGTTTKYWSGESERDLARVGWYMGNFEQRDARVTSRPPNPFGLRGMHGGIQEWCADRWQYDYSDAPRDGRSRTGGESERRVLRGGVWGDPPEFVTSAERDSAPPDWMNTDTGFRPAIEVSHVPATRN